MWKTEGKIEDTLEYCNTGYAQQQIRDVTECVVTCVSKTRPRAHRPTLCMVSSIELVSVKTAVHVP